MAKHCETCGTAGYTVLITRWDAYFCFQCKQWVETTCGDKECQFCANRP